MKHSPPPWRQSEKQPDAIVCDTEIPSRSEEHRQQDQKWYGGHCICEFVTLENRALILAAPEFYEICQMWMRVADANWPGIEDVENKMRTLLARIDKEES